LTGLIAHYNAHGLQPKEKKSGGRKNNTKALTYEEITAAVNFLNTYAEQHALPLPGRVPGFKEDSVTLLPCSHTKAEVYKAYKAAASQTG
jgi:hypothetical protein